MRRFKFGLVVVFMVLVFGPLFLPAQVTKADYDRSFGLREKFMPLALNLPERPSWVEKTSRFTYRKTVPGGFEFILVDAATLEKKPAFDHAKLAAGLAKASGEAVDAAKLPFQMITFIEGEKAVAFEFGEWRWTCDLATYTVTKVGPAQRRRGMGTIESAMRMWERGPAPQAASPEARPSPDGKWEAF
ncbi:MAG: hypothetical protein OEW05_11970, partial [Candidatus Aminicenantes bacterium]|nr:hypothetical protein [Candidatus Aminicenantes bacterium]